MQNTLFDSNQNIIKSEEERNLKKEIQNSCYDKAYFIKTIRNEMYLWDMRCWDKPKNEYSIKEIIKHVDEWLSDEWSCNCGHALFCIEKLLKYKWATKEEIAKVIMENNNIQFADEIGTWKD